MEKIAGNLVILRQLIIFVPLIIILPKYFGESAVWFTQPLVDLVIIIASLILLKNELNKLSKKKLLFA